METAQLENQATDFLEAWNTQDVEQVLASYTDDVIYKDPNTRGPVEGADALRRYLSKLFVSWQMHWDLKETFALLDADGAAVLWHATFRRTDTDETVEADGMDLVVMEGDRIKRNEVYFDRAVLAPLMKS